MKTAILSTLLLALGALTLNAGDRCQIEHSFGFSDGENNFFKPLMADIRAPVFNARILRFYPDPYTRPNNGSKHTFADVSFGGDFVVYGRSCEGHRETKKEGGRWVNTLKSTQVIKTDYKPGLAVLLDASVHSLLDFNTGSTNLVNSDFRFGLFFKHRLKNHNHWSYRIGIFHESTHLGDEYVLDAYSLPGFARYNVSHEALDLIASYDYPPSGSHWFIPKSYRTYGGGRIFLHTESFADYNPARPELKGHQTEVQLGQELIWGICKKCSSPWHLDNLIFAVDLQHRSEYNIRTPSYSWSYNAVLGVMAGEYFGNGKVTKIYLNYYNGVNPHGQFRALHTNYLGFNFGLNF